MAIDVAASELVLNLGGISPATVIIKDVLCSNGVIHVNDAVLDPADFPYPWPGKIIFDMISFR